MIKKLLSQMTLREKIGQTGIINYTAKVNGIKECGGYDKFFAKYPYSGMYVSKGCMIRPDGTTFETPEEAADAYRKASKAAKIPIFVTCDNERGARGFFKELHLISTNMLLGAAQSKELAYKRSYYYAKELKRCGVNMPLSPVVDLTHGLGISTRAISSDPQKIINLIPSIIKGFHDAGVASCCKHFPSNASGDYRDSHVSNVKNYSTLEEWRKSCGLIWKAAIENGTDSIMTGHVSFPDVDPSLTPTGKAMPTTASRKILNLLREELGFDGVVITDDCGMKSLSSSFSREDVYINCFNAGNDIILFCGDDYIDIMEQAVKDGRVSEEQIDQSVERILKLKEKLGLFDEIELEPPLTEEEIKDFEYVNEQIARKGITLVTNHVGAIPFDPKKVKNAAIISLSPDPRFIEQMGALVDAFAGYGVKTTIYKCLESKLQLKEIDENNDIIIYSCLLKTGFMGLPYFSTPDDFKTLFNGLSYGAKKSVIVSFTTPSVYYNYFEDVETYINAYSHDAGTMKTVVDGIFGEFEFTGESPVALYPEGREPDGFKNK